MSQYDETDSDYESSDDEPMLVVSGPKPTPRELAVFREQIPGRSKRKFPAWPPKFRDIYECEECEKYGKKCEECRILDKIRSQSVYDTYYGMPQQCTYCLELGHLKEECPALQTKKERICKYCGLYGHGDQPEKKCRKIQIGPQGQVGFCTWKECRKAKDQWGHYLVTCPYRQAEQGPYQFKTGENPRIAKAPLKPIK